MYAQYPDKEVIGRGAALIMSRQQRDGRWETEDTEGIFNKNCAIDYTGRFREDPQVHADRSSSIQVHLHRMGIGEGRQVSEELKMV